MNDQTSETTATQSSEETPQIYRWTILKRDRKADTAFIGPVWVEIGCIIADTSYSLYNDDITAIGEREDGGAGDYLCIYGDRAQRVSVVAETVYRLKEES